MSDMKRNIFISILLSLASLLVLGVVKTPAAAAGTPAVPVLSAQLQQTPIPLGGGGLLGSDPGCDADAVHALYFYSTDCPHCMTVIQEVLVPLEQEFTTKLDIQLVEVRYPENYELLIRAEEHFKVKAEERAIPTLILNDQVLIGEAPIRERLRGLIANGIKSGGIGWPAIPNLDMAAIITDANADASAGLCTLSSGDSCATAAPIYAAYFYQTGCDSCSRVEADLAYLRSKYPQLVVEKFNVFDQAGLGEWLAARAGRATAFKSPALFIGEYAWFTEKEITPLSVQTALECIKEEGSPKIWEEFDPAAGQAAAVERFRSMSWLTVVLAGLVDGLNPCAFATLIFFISYLTLSGRKGREVIFVGLSFTLGVFVAYLVIGFGFYKVLDLLGTWLELLGKAVYALTAVLCLGLAFFSFKDYLKVRHGDLTDMALKLPEKLRLRINKVIRQGRGVQSYALGAFATGLVISVLELACTGQVYLPTIIFVSSVPELRLSAMFYLVLYNLLFILPLVVVFILAYYGTTSQDLTRFLQKHAGAVKLGMTVLFLALGSWLLISIF